MGMTNAEAKEHLKDILADVPNDKCIDWIEALKQAIQALEQQPSEDCISRAKLNKLICQNNDKYGYSDRFHEFTERCLQLPSVTPQPKIGYWIDGFGGCRCSECDCLEAGYSDYCPSCGAKMEVEE